MNMRINELNELNELCSRKLLDMYKSANVPQLKSAIKQVLAERDCLPPLNERQPSQHH